MSRLLCAVLAGVLLFSSAAFAEGLKVEDSRNEYVEKLVAANNVRGVKIGLMKKEFRQDCNERAVVLEHVLVSGDGAGWHDKYFLDGYVMQTLMYCPLDKPILETIYSAPIFIKSFANENIKNEVRISVIIPKGFELKVVEVSLSDPEKEGRDDQKWWKE